MRVGSILPKMETKTMAKLAIQEPIHQYPSTTEQGTGSRRMNGKRTTRDDTMLSPMMQNSSS